MMQLKSTKVFNAENLDMLGVKYMQKEFDIANVRKKMRGTQVGGITSYGSESGFRSERKVRELVSSRLANQEAYGSLETIN